MGAEPAVAEGPALRRLQGRPVLPEGRHGALVATRSARATRTSRTRASSSATRSTSRTACCARATSCWCGRRRRGRSCPTPPSPSTPSSPTCARANGEVLAEALVTRVVGEDATVADRFKGADMIGAGYEPPFPYIPASEYGEKGHTVLPADFVSAEDGTGIVHTAIAFGEDDFRLGAEQGLAVINPVRADGTYDERIGPYEGRFVKDADDDLIEDLRGPRPPVPRRAAVPRLPALLALRHAAALLRQAVLVHPHLAAARPPAGRQRERRLAPRAHQARAHGPLAGEQRRLGAVPRALLGHAAPDLAQRGGRDRLRRLVRGARGAQSGVKLEDPHRPFVDDVEIPSPTGGEPLKRVPEVIDVWFDTGSHAVRPVARAVREPGQVRASSSPRTTSARASTRRAAGSTACSRSARCCSTRARTRRA